ncbi:hypothetical protein ACJX0J_001482 [Zea mays]
MIKEKIRTFSSFVSISRYLFLYIYILLVQEEDCTMREAQSLSTEARLATGIELSIHSAISRAQLDALSPFNPLSEIRVALWRAQPKGVVDGQQVNIPNESNLPKDVIYSLSLSIYGKNCTHAMIFKSFLLKWNSDFRTISYKRMKKILLIFLFLKIFDPSPRRLVSIEEIKEVEKFVDLWLKKKNKKTGVLLNFKGLRRLLGKRQRLLAYLAKKNRNKNKDT